MRDRSSVWLCGQSLNRSGGKDQCGCHLRNRQLSLARITLPAWPTRQRRPITGVTEKAKRRKDTMSRIFVVDQEHRPLMPCTPARARILLKQRKAAILRRFPLVLILREARPDAVVDPLRRKLDPGAKTSGVAVTNDRSGEE